MTREEQFEKALNTALCRQREFAVCEPKRFLANAQKHGTLAALKEQLRRRQASENFDTLAERNLLSLSPEALVVSQKYGALFTDEEADFCLELLLAAGYFGASCG